VRIEEKITHGVTVSQKLRLLAERKVGRVPEDFDAPVNLLQSASNISLLGFLEQPLLLLLE